MMQSVYVLTNIAMPGFVKVGYATSVVDRVRQLSSPTGVPADFDVAFEIAVDDAKVVEAIAHDLLAHLRVNSRREFFRTKARTAEKALQIAALMAAWNKASPDARREFLGRIDSPLMDRRWE